jgi:hypothetical protein
LPPRKKFRQTHSDDETLKARGSWREFLNLRSNPDTVAV